MRGKTILILVMILSINIVVANPYSFNLYDETTTTDGNISDFLELTDTPSSYTGDGDKCVTVKNDETGLEFTTCTGGGGGIINISEAGDVDVSGVSGDDVLRWDDAVKKWVDSKLNSILTFSSNWLFFSGDNEITFNETRLNETGDIRYVNVGEDINATNVTIAIGTGSPTVDQLQEYIDNTGSSGFFIGGILSDGGSGTVDVSAGEGFIRTTNDENAELQSFKWSESLGIPVADNTSQYVYVDYLGVVSLSQNEFLEAPNKIQIGVVNNEDGEIDHFFNLGVRLEESIAEAGRFIRRVHGISRDARKGGLIFGQSGDANRYVTMTAGSLWWGRTEYPITSFDTSGADTFNTYSASGEEDPTASQFPNTQYDNSGTLTTMTNNRWANLFFYIEPDDHISMVYGRGQFVTQAQAEMEGVPSESLPSRITETAILASRFTFKKSSDTATIVSSFDTVFTAAGVTDHGNLAGLSDDDHQQYLLVDGSRDGTGNITINANWFNGLFNWTVLTNWLNFDGSTLIFNETKLNETIDSRSLWETDGENISYSLGNVGIGTTNPTHKLNVLGTSNFTQNTTFGERVSIMTFISSIWNLNVGGDVRLQDNVSLGGSEANPVLFLNDGTGRVGINTKTPLAAIDIRPTGERGMVIFGSGLGNIQGFDIGMDFPTSALNGRAFTIGVDGEGSSRIVFYSNGFYGIGPGDATRDVFLGRSSENTMMIGGAFDGSGTGNLIVNGDGNFTADLIVQDDLFVFDQVGIGTTNPLVNLQISGASNPSIRISEGGSSSSFSQFSDTSVDRLAISKVTSSGVSNIDIDPIPSDKTSNANFRFFRNTNTTGKTSFQVLKGDGTSSTNSLFSGNDDSYINALIGNVGIGTVSPSEKLEVADTVNGQDVRIELSAPDDGGTVRVGQIFFDPDTNTIGLRNGGVNVLHVDNNNMVGIGTATPDALLHIFSSTASVITEIESSMVNSNSGFRLINDVQTWQFTTHGSEGDRFKLRDVTGSADPFQIESGANDNALYIKSNGDVGIGTASPGAKLHIRESSTGFSAPTFADSFIIEAIATPGMTILSSGGINDVNIIFSDSDAAIDGRIAYRFDGDSNNGLLSFGAGGSEYMFIRGSDGNVGIGVTNPQDLLVVQGRNAVNGGQISVQATDLSISNNQKLGSFNFRTVDTSTNVLGIRARITGVAEGAYNNNDAPTGIAFEVTPDGSTTLSEAMRINNGGNVGIGTIAPTERLELADPLGSNTHLSFYRKDSSIAINNAIGTIDFKGDGGGTAQLGGQISFKADGTWASGDIPTRIEFNLAPDGSDTLATRMTIKQNGNIGIGVTSPGADLEVQGNVIITDGTESCANTANGDLCVDNDLEVDGVVTFANDLIGTNTGDIGWTIQTQSNTACETTCNSACVEGFNIGTPVSFIGHKVSCSDATADECTCAGPS